MKKLLRRLGPAGGLSLFWLFLWAAANRSNGDLVGMTDEDIELAIDWSGEPGAFVAACGEVKFLDGIEGSRVIHDWAEHNPWAAGAEERSEKSRFAALCKQHGRPHAIRAMPEYAARIGEAPEQPARAAEADANGERKDSQDGARGIAEAATGSPEGATGTPLAGSGTAPSPSPFPSPIPSPLPIPSPAPTLFSEEPQSGVPAPPPPPLVIEIECVDGSLYPVTQDDVTTWARAFPAVDIPLTLERMKVWVLTNPTRRKTRKGMPRFITKWLGDEQDKGGTRSMPAVHRGRRPTSHNGLDTKNYSEGIENGYLA